MKKIILQKRFCLLFFCCIAIINIKAQTQQLYTQIPLNDLSAFKSPSANWSVAGGVTGSFSNVNSIEKKSGTGILVNELTKGKNEDIFTNLEYGDIDLDLDFMMPKGSNSGIYLQGRYEIQLFDSWGVKTPAIHDLGAIYQRWDETRPEGQQGYEGTAPRLNVAKAPGLWQNIKIIFLAPKFDASGKKVANAKVVKIVLNGVAIIENAELTGPTRGSAFTTESATGPLRFQGDHGPVAFKNIRYNNSVSVKANDGTATKSFFDVVDRPVFVEVKDEPVILRSFVNMGDKIISHAVNVGYANNVSFTYDLSNGALLQVWKGGFVDASPMWHFRGGGSVLPVGDLIILNDAPALAVISSDNQAWSDTLSNQSLFRAKGYELDENGYPTFKYTLYNINVEDKITPSNDGKMLVRKVSTMGGKQNNLYCRIANGEDIVLLANGMYSINNFQYYLQLPQDNKIKPLLRNTSSGKELLMPVSTDENVTIQYSLIW